MKAAAIYARVSSERQREEQTIASQTAALREYAQTKGYAVAEEWVFQDEGYSGAVLVRPALERLRDLAATGQIEAVLIYSPDRLTRKYAYQVLLTEEFARQGATIIFIKSPQATTPEEHLMQQFQGMIAEYERAQITERTRRGKRHKAMNGLVNVLCGAPYGYRYIKRSEASNAFYEVMEEQAAVVREMFRLYTEESYSIAALVRWLNAQGIPTRRGALRWQQPTIAGMLHNPAYKGVACFGKRERADAHRITRRSRQRGILTPRPDSSRPRPRDQWIEIPVPAIVSAEIFALAQERLETNKHFSRRHTKVPTLLQGLLVCRQCGCSLYRVGGCAKGKKYYYRCFSSFRHLHPDGRICSNRPVRQDYLDELVWKEVVDLLENPELIRAEIDRRIQERRQANPAAVRKEVLVKERARIQKGIDRLLDVYQEGMLPLEELRKRVPPLRKREAAVKSELEALDAEVVDRERYNQLAGNLDEFRARMRESSANLDIENRRRIVRLVIKEILVGPDTLTIKHSIPTSGAQPTPKYQLCTRSHPTFRLFGTGLS